MVVKNGAWRCNKDVSFLKIYASYDNFEKKWWQDQDIFYIITGYRLTNWIFQNLIISATIERLSVLMVATKLT